MILADSIGVAIPILFAILIWSLDWKAMALWTSASSTHFVWFIILLLVHTVAILEILYLFAFAKMSFDSKPKTQKIKPVKKVNNPQ